MWGYNLYIMFNILCILIKKEIWLRFEIIIKLLIVSGFCSIIVDFGGVDDVGIFGYVYFRGRWF